MSNKKIAKLIAGFVVLALVLGGGSSAFQGDNSSSNNSYEQSNQSLYNENELSSADDSGNEETVAQDKQNENAQQKQDGSTATTASSSKKALKVTFFDVGEGDSALVQCDGHNMLIDGGPRDASSILYSYFSRNKIKKLDYVIATHPDTDHTGGISGALQVAQVKHAYSSVTSAKQKAFNSMKSTLKTQGVSIKVPRCGDTWKLGSAQVKVIGPKTYTDNGNNNDDSIMLKISYGKTVFVFTGDANYEEEKGARAYLDGCDVLKVGHHGSSSSSSYAFLRSALPKYAVISVGKGNGYGHPKEKALSRLRDCGAKVYRTDLQGDIVATSNGKKVTMSVGRNVNANTLKPGA